MGLLVGIAPSKGRSISARHRLAHYPRNAYLRLPKRDAITVEHLA
jgi:hypothetical protein